MHGVNTEQYSFKFPPSQHNYAHVDMMGVAIKIPQL